MRPRSHLIADQAEDSMRINHRALAKTVRQTTYRWFAPATAPISFRHQGAESNAIDQDQMLMPLSDSRV